MAKFGLYKARRSRPLEEYEGDRMIHYVQIVIDRPGDHVEVVAMIKLREGEEVKRIKAPRAR